jgi:protein TonB
MTRIRFIEWLLAAVLVVVLHGVAITGWTWFEPTRSGVRLPEKLETTVAAPGNAIALSVSITGQEQPAAPALSPSPAPQTGSSNEIIVVPTEPSALETGPGQSTVLVEAPTRAAPMQQQQQATPTQAAPEPPPLTALEPPPIDQIAPGSRSSRSPLRDPVPLPKIKPGTETESGPPQTPPAVGSDDANATTQTAAVDSRQPSADNEPASAAQSAYYRILLAEIKRAQRYPEDAKREGKEGTVYLQIVVLRTGRIRSYDIVKSSGFQELDDAAVQTLVRANEKLPPFPDEITDGELRFGLPMRFGS